MARIPRVRDGGSYRVSQFTIGTARRRRAPQLLSFGVRTLLSRGPAQIAEAPMHSLLRRDELSLPRILERRSKPFCSGISTRAPAIASGCSVREYAEPDPVSHSRP